MQNEPRIQKTQQTGRRLRGNFGQMWKFGWKNVEIWVEIFGQHRAVHWAILRGNFSCCLEGRLVTGQ